MVQNLSWRNKNTENAMLELADARDDRSRLACQIIAAPELDGLVVHTPEGQH